jgi:hypothetical protein
MSKSKAAAPAPADAKVTDDKPKIGPRTMTTEEALELEKALDALDALIEVGYAIVTIGHTRNRLKTALKPYNDAKTKLIKRLSDGTMTILPTIAVTKGKETVQEPNPKYKEFVAEHGKMTEQDVTFKAFPLKVSDLNLEKNNVRSSTISALIGADMLIDDSDEGEAEPAPVAAPKPKAA